MNRKTQIVFAVFIVGLIASPIPAQELGEVRAAMHAKYDQNKDGRLDAEEREAMRLAIKKARTAPSRGRRRRFEPPKKWVERYDADKSGELSDTEVRTAFESEMELMKKSYDKDANGTLDDEEKQAIKTDLQERKFEGMDAWMAARLSGAYDRRRRDGGERKLSREERWLEFDKNKNGRADAEELNAIREYEAKSAKDKAADSDAE